MEKVMAYKANDGTLFDSYNECLKHETKDYPKIEGYTCYGEYYLSNTIIKNKTFYEAMLIKEIVNLPNGKTVTAHTLSKEELESILEEGRAFYGWYWTSTPYIDIYAWDIHGNGDFYNGYINLSSDGGGARLGFKNPFLN
jgi:hypothetical protein